MPDAMPDLTPDATPADGTRAMMDSTHTQTEPKVELKTAESPPTAPEVVVPRGFAGSACRITFTGLDPSEPPKVEVRAWIDRLGALTAPLVAGHVVIDTIEDPRKPRLYRVRMELAMPDRIVAVGLDHPSNKPHEDLYCAIRNAFRAARRELEVYAQSRDARPVAAPVIAAAALVPGPMPCPDEVGAIAVELLDDSVTVETVWSVEAQETQPG